MLLLSSKDWTGYLVELIVVVPGILIAFQVDEWRDDLQIESNTRAALIRLRDETHANLKNCEDFVPRTSRLARNVQTVLKSLQIGEQLAKQGVD
jgi:hypothetical protein